MTAPCGPFIADAQFCAAVVAADPEPDAWATVWEQECSGRSRWPARGSVTSQPVEVVPVRRNVDASLTLAGTKTLHGFHADAWGRQTPSGYKHGPGRPSSDNDVWVFLMEETHNYRQRQLLRRLGR